MLQTHTVMTITTCTSEAAAASAEAQDESRDVSGKVESRASFEARRKEAQVRRRRKKKTERTLVATSFTDL